MGETITGVFAKKNKVAYLEGSNKIILSEL